MLTLQLAFCTLQGPESPATPRHSLCDSHTHTGIRIALQCLPAKHRQCPPTKLQHSQSQAPPQWAGLPVQPAVHVHPGNHLTSIATHSTSSTVGPVDRGAAPPMSGMSGMPPPGAAPPCARMVRGGEIALFRSHSQPAARGGDKAGTCGVHADSSSSGRLTRSSSFRRFC